MSGTNRLKRYKDFVWFLYKYGTSDVFRQSREMIVTGGDGSGEAVSYDPSPAEFVEDLQQMGPTFVKLGQLLSTRPDLLPPEYLEPLEKLQDRAGQVPFEEIREIVESELQVKISKAFERFDPEPLASASLGQVHFAMLPSSKPVAVKVQRPGIRQQVIDDLDAIENVIALAENLTSVADHFSLKETFSGFRRMLLRELDYQEEARHMLIIGESLRSMERILIPQPVEDYTTTRVLTMEFVKGAKVTKLSPLRLIETDGETLVKDLIGAYIRMIMEDGVFHADPHPGNVHLTGDNRLALLDFGMVSRIDNRHQELLLRLLHALSDNRSERTAEIIMSMSTHTGRKNEEEFRQLVSELMLKSRGTAIKDLNLGRLMISLNRAAALNGYVIPPVLNIIGKTLLNLDRIAEILAPNLDPSEYIRMYSVRVMSRRVLREFSPDNVGVFLLETRSLLERLPQRLDVLSKNLAEGEFRLRIDALGRRELLGGMQKIANRITLGLLIAALIIGAALLMRVSTEFRIWGYPGLAMIFFMIAAAGAVLLALQIIYSDKKR